MFKCISMFGTIVFIITYSATDSRILILILSAYAKRKKIPGFSLLFSPRASRSISLKVVVVLVVLVVVVSVVTFCKNSQIAVDRASTDGAYQLLQLVMYSAVSMCSIRRHQYSVLSVLETA